MFPEDPGRIDLETHQPLSGLETPFNFEDPLATSEPALHDETPPQRRYVRSLLAILMVVVVLFSISYAALQPWLRPFSSSQMAPRLEGAITGISATNTNNCRYAPSVTLEGALFPTDNLCICGRVYVDVRTALRYVLVVRDEAGETVGQSDLQSGFGTLFCQRVRLADELEDGQYTVELHDHENARRLDVFHFSIQSKRSL